ncbi:chromate transporter [Flavobacterium palustre]|uniref:chromate transporter n=1 Tax=Flavobacterium palustre TaxID=1476463 RepID=UPI003618A1ED
MEKFAYCRTLLILPAVFITGILHGFTNYTANSGRQPFVYGIKPAIIAIILAAVFPLAKKSLKIIRTANYWAYRFKLFLAEL